MYDDATYNVDPQNIEGDMTVENSRQRAALGEPGFNTLDEPIRDTFVSAIFVWQLDEHGGIYFNI